MKSIKITPRKNHLRVDGTCTLYAVFTFNRISMRLNMGVSVALDDWDDLTQSVKNSEPAADDINLLIQDYRSRITDVFVRARLQNIPLTKSRFLEMFNNPLSSTHVVSFMRAHLKELSAHLTYGTFRHHKAVIDKFEQYYPTLTFSEFNTNSLFAFSMHLRNAHQNNHGTIRKNLQIIHQYVHAALEKNLIFGDPFKNLKLPPDNPRHVFLKEAELEKLINLHRAGTLEDHLQDILRFFLLMCYTGMHISDARALRVEDTDEGIVRYERIKTMRLVKVPICDRAAEIIDYYAAGRSQGVLVRDLPSNQAINRYLKMIGSVAGLRKNMSAIVARHTFASMYMKYNSDDAVGLASLLGHSSIRYVGVYAHAEREKLIKGVSIFDSI